MCRHYTEIRKPETEFAFRVLHGNEHNFPPQPVFKNTELVVNQERNVVKRPFDEFSFFTYEFLCYILGMRMHGACMFWKTEF